MTQARDLADNKLTGDVEIDGTTLTVDSTNNRVGIGTNLPDSLTTLSASNGNAILELNRSTTNTTGAVGTINFTASDGHSVANMYAVGDGDNEGAHLVFRTTSAAGENDPYGSNTFERMRIDSNGNLLVGTTSSIVGKVDVVQGSNALGLYVYASDSASYTSTVFAAQGNRLTTNRTYKLADFVNPNGTGRCFIYDSGDLENTNNSYSGISDVKLKTDIVDATSQWDDIKALRFRKYKMIADPEQRIQMGLIAQELEATSPNLVDESVDRDFEGNDLGTTTKSIKYSILYIKAVKALQEAIERIETLETQNASLEARIVALENA